MRLIDIEDEMLLKNLSEGRRSAKQVVKLFMKQPIIEAIPIEWLLSKKYEIATDTEAFHVNYVIDKVVDLWRKENESTNSN